MSCDQRRILAARKLFSDFSFVNIIGQGSFGDIYEAIDLQIGGHSTMKTERLAVRKQALRHV
jgi:hypothetical protein